MKKEEIMNALENEHLKLFEWLEKQTRPELGKRT